MTSDRKKPGVAFWVGIGLLAVLAVAGVVKYLADWLIILAFWRAA